MKSSLWPVSSNVSWEFILGLILFNISIDNLDNAGERTLSTFAEIQNQEEKLICQRAVLPSRGTS